MEITVDIDGPPLNETGMTQTIEAFMRASNTAYAATQRDCQPEFRRLEEIKEHASTSTTQRRLDDDAEGGEDNDSGRALQRRMKTRTKLTIRTHGTCNGCTGKVHVGNRVVDTTLRWNLPTRKFRQLQQVQETSNCFCPLGSTVETEPPGRQTLMLLFQEELARIKSPIVNVTEMLDLLGNAPPTQRVRRLQTGTSLPPPPDPGNMTETSNDIPNPPLHCPMIKLEFTNFSYPMACWYGQSSSTLQGGDYLFDQLWWTHGVKVSARIRNPGHSKLKHVWIPKFIRGGGWVDSRTSHNVTDYTTAGAVRLFDTMRPTFNTDPKFHQPLCPKNGKGGNPDLGSPHKLCPNPGPGKYKKINLTIILLHFFSFGEKEKNDSDRTLHLYPNLQDPPHGDIRLLPIQIVIPLG